MKINNNTVEQYRSKQKDISYKGVYDGGRSIIRTLSNPDALASTIVLESFVTGGRGLNAYKRGGFHEFRERFTDDVVSAIFWMKGVDLFNKLGNKFGKYVLKLPTTDFDVGKDALRTPFQNIVAELGKDAIDEKAAKALEKKLAAFKFSKIILSTLLATGFVGFILPKINQAITEKLINKERHDKKQEPQPQKQTFDLLNDYSFDEFNKKLSQKDVPSFKGIFSPTMMTTVAHYLENNKICKMLSCDAGILSGRVITARNADEGREYFFRDASSSFFYFASTPLVYKMLQKISGSNKFTNIDPVASKQIHSKMLEQLRDTNGGYISMNAKEFASKTIGFLDDAAKELMAKLPFKSDVISLKELEKYIADKNIIQKAEEMAKLQPEQAGIGKVLTRQQVSDVLKNGSLNTPEFMQNIFHSKFGDSLTNPYRYIPMQNITKFRDHIEDYAQSVIETANKKNGGIIDKKLLDRINNKSFLMSAAFRIIAMGVSAFALGVLIPKMQYAMTARRTGKDDAPGLRKFNEESK